MKTKETKGLNSENVFEKEILHVLTQVKNGNFSVRMPIEETGIHGKICDTLNDIIEMNEKMVYELTTASTTIGKNGQLDYRVSIPAGNGAWREGVDSVNTLITDLVKPTTEIADVISSVAKGNLSHTMPLEIGDHKLKGSLTGLQKR